MKRKWPHPPTPIVSYAGEGVFYIGTINNVDVWRMQLGRTETIIVVYGPNIECDRRQLTRKEIAYLADRKGKSQKKWCAIQALIAIKA